jgi:hypothetical protein
MGRSAIIGSHFMFLPQGTSIDAVTVGVDDKPDSVPTTNWTDYTLGCVESISMSNDVTEEAVRCPVSGGGAYQEANAFALQQNLTANITLAELNPLLWQVIWMADTISPTGPTSAFVPLAAGAFLKGWSRITMYDESNVLISTAEFWSQLRLNGNVDFQEAVTKIPVALKIFTNALNVGTLSSFF